MSKERVKVMTTVTHWVQSTEHMTASSLDMTSVYETELQKESRTAHEKGPKMEQHSVKTSVTSKEHLAAN